MNFEFSEEQTLLRNTVQRFLQNRYDWETRQAIVASEEGWRRDYWQEFAELGLLAAPFPEELGGFGEGAIGTMVIMEEFGKGLVVEPFTQTVVLCGGLLRAGGTTAQKEELIGGIISGETVMSLAYAEPRSRYSLNVVATSAKKSGSEFTLNGQKAVVVGAPWANRFIVSARTSGGPSDRSGITLFVVDRNASGMTLQDYPTVDGQRASEIILDNVKVSADMVVGEVDNGLPLLERAVDEGIAAICAEAVGVMEMLTNITVDYSKQRKQFGTPIGKFQVLQHRMVDMFTNYEQARSISYRASMHVDASDAERMKAISGAKVFIGRAGRFVGQSAVQIHGGMGVTDELNVGHYFKRITTIDTMFGNVDYHMRRFMTLSGLGPKAA